MEHASPPRETRFGPYTVVREIGRGAMATVYEAVHRALGKRVAIKVLSDAMRSAPNGTARFFREARIVGQLHHPHIVDAIDIGEIDGRPYLVMELLEGDDLESHLKRHGVLTPAETVDLLLPVASAVSAAHESGVVHRDLKPSNILVARRGGRVHPVVVDFGVSKRDDDVARSQLTHPETLVGTIAYMAPEQVRGARHASRMSDQYAIGVILYRCLTGELPFDGAGEYETMASIVNAPLVPPSQLNPTVPPALDAIVLRAMHRQASRRYPSVLALGSDLLALASAEALTLWSGEMASDAQAQAIARAAGGTRVELAPVPTQVTHVTEVLPSAEGRRWHYRLLAGAVAFAVVAAGVSRMPRFQPAASAAMDSSAKVAPRKERLLAADALAAPVEASVARAAEKPRALASRPLPTSLPPAKDWLAMEVHGTPPSAKTVTGPNGAPDPRMTVGTWLRRGSRASLVVAVLTLGERALADVPPAEDPALQHGIQLRKESRDAEALEEFRRSYAQRPTSRARAQIALALQALGRWLEAETELGAALADHDDAWIAKNRGTLEKAQGTIAQHLGTFEGTSNVEATELFVNGVPVAPGQPLRVVAGSILVDARAPGYSPVRRAVDVPAMGVARETFMMAKLEPMATEQISTALAGAAPVRPTSPAPLGAQMPSSRGAPAQRTWGWVAVAAGGASLVAGVVATIVRENNAQIYNDESRCPAADRSHVCGPQRDTVNLATGVAIGGYVAAGVLLTTGAVLLLSAPKRQTASTPALSGVGAWLAPEAGGVAFLRQF